MRSVDLNLLRSLEVLLEERHVTRAARRLGISQPALSAQLARLRDLFEDPLLVPEGKRLVPTRRARGLQAGLSAHLSGLAGLLAAEQDFDPAVDAVEFQIAASDVIQRAVGAPLAARLLEAAPHCRMALRQPDAARLDEQMRRGEISLVIGPDTLTRGPGWRRERLFTQRFVTVMRRDHPLAPGPLTLDAFCAARHLMVSPTGGGFDGLVDQVLAARGLSRRVVLSVQDFLMIPSLLRDTDLIVTTPDALAASLPDGFHITAPPVEIPGFGIFMAWRPDAALEPALDWLRGAVRTICAERS